MLPPLQAIANASISYQDQRIEKLPGNGSALPMQAPVPQSPSGLDLNSAIAGRLNILLLSGQERMAESFLILADLFGRSLGLQRREGETPGNFTRRLAEVLLALPAPRQAVIERQLAQLFGGLPLRTVIGAFENPTGPDAAMMAVHLEAAGNAGRDPATTSVVTTYRQNGVEQRATPGPASGAPVAVPQADDASQSSAAHPGAAANQGTSTPARAATPQQPQPVAHGQSIPEPRAMTGGPALDAGIQEQSPDAPTTTPRSVPQPSNAGSGTGTAEEPALAAALPRSEGGDIHVLQQRLRQNFEGAADEAYDGLPEGPGRTDLRAADKAETPKSAAERPRGNDASGSGDRSQTLLVLKGWQEVMAPPLTPANDETAGTALDKILRAGIFSPHADPEPLQAQASQSEGEPLQADAAAKQKADPQVQADPEILSKETEAAQDLRNRTETATGAWRALDPQTAVAQAVPAAREAFAPSTVNYFFAPDQDEKTDLEEARRQFHHGEDRGGEGAASDFAGEGDGGREEAPDDANDETVAASNDQVEADEMLSVNPTGAEADRANDLYWRMAGWS